jgi:membrane-bound serine protease (ClpP class)
MVGVGLVLVGITLLVVEATVPGWGGPGALGIVSTVAGVLFLLDEADVLQLPPGVVVALCVLAAIFVPAAVVLMMRARRVPVSPPASLVGAEGVALSDLDPYGTVRVRSEEWSAESEDGAIQAGAKVKVLAEDGLKLRVGRQ